MMTPAVEHQPGTVPVSRLELALWAVTVLSCSQLGYVGDPKHGPFVAAADVLCVLVAAAWGVLALRRRRLGAVPLAPRALIAWVAVGLLSLSKCALDAEGSLSLGALKAGLIEVAQVVLYFGLAYSLFADTLSGALKVRRLTRVLLVAVTVVVAWGLADYLVESDPGRVAAGFGNRNVYSAFLVVVLPLLFGQAMHERRVALKAWAFAVCGVGALTMLAPPHLWLLVGIMAWQVYARGGRRRAVLLAAMLGVCALIVTVPRNYQCNVSELLDPFERGELFKLQVPAGGEAVGEAPTDEAVRPPIRKRWLEWQPALAMLAENVPLGVGAGSFQRNIGEAVYYGTLPNARKSEPDTANLYLVVGASMGLPGLVCLVALMLHFSGKASRLWLAAESSSERGLAAGLHGAMLGIMLANIFTSLFVRGVALIWTMTMAMVSVMARASAARKA